MIFWIITGSLTALAVGLLLLPLLRRPGESAPRAASDLDVYRDQLAEIALETERGELGAEQAAAARTEIERRLLAAAETSALQTPGGITAEQNAGQGAPRRAGTWVFAATLPVVLPVAAIGLYLVLGVPEISNLPFAERPPPPPPAAAAAPPAEPGFAQEMGDLAERLAKRLAEDPDNRDGWLLLGRTYAELGRYAKAAEVYRQAIALGFDGAETQSALGEVLATSAGGRIGPEARRAFAVALENEPSDPRARYYMGLTLAQDGRVQEALDIWTDLLRQASPDAPWRSTVEQQVHEAAAQLGIEPPELPAALAAAPERAPRGPSAADVQAAQEMSPDEQAAFIRSMVARLAARLEAEPGDFQGWLRLARAYTVLGETAKARDALERAAELVRGLPESAPERAQLTQAQGALPLKP